jgi:hypothetical protein
MIPLVQFLWATCLEWYDDNCFYFLNISFAQIICFVIIYKICMNVGVQNPMISKLMFLYEAD